MAATRSVEVLYFSRLREARRTPSEKVVTAAASPRELYTELRLEQAYPLDPRWVRVAINDEFASWESELHEGDRVAFITPVAGG